MSKIDSSLFTGSEHGHQQAFGNCPQCQSLLHVRHSKNGPFIGCSSYPKCDFSKPLHEFEDSQIKLIDGSACPECGSLLAIKKGRYGMFIGCSSFPDCHHIESTNEAQETPITCPGCQKHSLVKRNNRFGKVFWACDGYPKCKFVVNHQPVQGVCQSCGFKLLINKGKDKKQCADKKCQHIQTSD